MHPCRDHHRKLVALALTCTLVAGTGAAAVNSAVGAGGDPLQAPGCRAAIASLQAGEADASAQAHSPAGAQELHAPPADLLAARRDAARRCLASRADPPAPPGG